MMQFGVFYLISYNYAGKLELLRELLVVIDMQVPCYLSAVLHYHNSNSSACNVFTLITPFVR